MYLTSDMPHLLGILVEQPSPNEVQQLLVDSGYGEHDTLDRQQFEELYVTILKVCKPSWLGLHTTVCHCTLCKAAGWPGCVMNCLCPVATAT